MDYKGKQVKLLLQGNTIIEGIVKSWNSNSVQLFSLDGKSTSIITHPNEDIRVIKVIHETQVSSEAINNVLDKIPATVSVPVQELEKQFEEIYNQPSENELRLKNLAELKKELIKQEKEIIASKLRSHHVGDVRKVQYEQPGFFKKQSVK